MAAVRHRFHPVELRRAPAGAPLGWEEQLAPPLLVYPAMAAAICLLLWLVFFS
jgi:hypothetical protein